jgi:hypothetical protein
LIWFVVCFVFLKKFFEKKKSGNNGVWLIHNQLISCEEKSQKASFDPFISSLGVKKAINNVNKTK